MKRIGILLVLFVFGFTFLVSAQQNSLGELAKKEKERREAIEKSGKKAKVLTNEDISKIKSQLAIEGASSEGEEGQPVEEFTYTPPQEGEEYIPAPEQPAPADPEAEHQKQLNEVNKEIDEAKKASEEARATVGAGGLYHSRNTGDQYKKAGEAEEKIEELEKQKEKLSGQQQAQEPAPAPPQEEYVPPPEETTEEPPAEEPPSF